SPLLISGIQLYEKHPIAGGGFADIYLAILDEKPVALKHLRIFKLHQDWLKTNHRFVREAAIWKELDHPNILPFFGVDAATFEPHLCMVSPWMENGDILGYCTNKATTDITDLLEQVALGLGYLHQESIVHGDLCGNNILVDDTGRIRLSDFDLAVFDDATQSNPSSSTSHHGSVRWMAPELHFPRDFGLSQFKRTFSTDVYAYACVCLEPPFMEITNEAEVLIEISKGLRPGQPSTLPVGRVVAESLWAIFHQCWNKCPDSR
ncbi:kinase-like protein, partial [Neolentinus lepideus HHB14362 ss-1]